MANPAFRDTDLPEDTHVPPGEVLNMLFEHVRPPDPAARSGKGKYRWTNAELARWLTDNGHQCSDSSIGYLRKNRSEGLSWERMLAIAAFFGVHAGVFFARGTVDDVAAQLDLHRALAEGAIDITALRSAIAQNDTRAADKSPSPDGT